MVRKRKRGKRDKATMKDPEKAPGHRRPADVIKKHRENIEKAISTDDEFTDLEGLDKDINEPPPWK